MLEGKIPYKDFESSYSPLFPYLLGFSYMLVPQFSAAVLLFMSFAALTTVFLYKTLNVLYPQHKEKITLLFLLSPMLWVFSIGLYQDEMVSAFFLILSFYLWITGRKDYSMLVLGLGFAFTKIIFLIFIPVFLLNSRNKFRHIAILSLILFLIFIPFVILGADILQPIKDEAGFIQGPTIWSVMNFFGINLVKFILPLFSIILFSSYFLIHKFNISVLDGVLLVSLLFMLFSSKTIEFYASIFIPLFFLYIANKTVFERKIFYFYNIFIPISYFFTTTLYGGLLNNVIVFMYNYLPFVANPLLAVAIVLLVNFLELFFVYRILKINIGMPHKKSIFIE